MPLRKQVKEFLFATGPDSQNVIESLPDGQLSIVENAQFVHLNSLQHSNGSELVSTNVLQVNGNPTYSTLPTPEAIATINGNLASFVVNPCTQGTNKVPPYPNTACQLPYSVSSPKWTSHIPASSVITDVSTYGGVGSPYFSTSDSASFGSFCVGGDGKLYSSECAGGPGPVLVRSFDPITKQVLSNFFTTLAGENKTKSISVNGTVYFLYKQAATNNLRAIQFSGGNLVEQLIATDINTSSTFDAWVDPSSAAVFVAYQNTTPTLTIKKFTNLDTIGTPNVSLTPVATATAAINPANNITIVGNLTMNSRPSVYVSFSRANTITADIYAFDLSLSPRWTGAAFFAGTAGKVVSSIAMSTTERDGSTLSWYVSTEGSGTAINIIGFDSFGVGGTTYTVQNLNVYSNLITIGNFDYVWLVGKRTNQKCFYLATTRGIGSYGVVTNSFFYICGKVFSGEALIPTNGYGRLASIVNIGTGYYCPALSIAADFGSAEGNANNGWGVGVVTTGNILFFDLTEITRWEFRDLAGSLHCTGGNIQQYDGVNFAELGFPEYPDASSVTLTSVHGDGSGPAASTYQYILVYEYIDATGKVHLSAPSAPISITTGANDQYVSLTFRDNIYGITNKNFYRIQIYRTLALGSTFYFENVTYFGASSGTYLSYLNAGLNTAIGSNAILYTQSGELENWCPWGVYALEIFKNRLFALTPEGVRYSKVITSNTPVMFPAEFLIKVESDGGRPTAFGVLQDKLLIFKREKIYYITGDGPNETGTYGDFSPITLINTAYGCVNSRTVVSEDASVYFWSPDTVRRIHSNFKVDDIGSEIIYYLNSGPLVYDAKRLSSTRNIRWVVSNKTFQYNYQVEKWQVLTDRGAYGQTMINDDYYFIGNSYGTPKICHEVTNSIAEAFLSTTSQMRVATGWIRLDQLQGFARVYEAIITCRIRGPHKLQIQVMYDYVPSVVESHTIDESSSSSYIYTDTILYDGGTASSTTSADQTRKPERYRIRFNRQKTNAIRLIISDIDYSGGAGTADLIGLSFVLGMKNVAVKPWSGDTSNV